MKTPMLWRRKIAGKYIGALHVTIKGKRINLHTQDAEKARKRRVEAMRGKRTFEDDSQGAADSVIAALDATPPDDGGDVDGAARTDAGGVGHPAEGAPPLLALPPMPADEPVIDPEPIPAESTSSWTDDVAGAGAAAADAAAAPASDGARSTHIGDLPILAGMFITVSRLLVQMQIAGQVAAAKKFAKFDVPMLSDPPPKDLGEFLAQQGQKWPDTDPREPGRQIWEGFLRRICPTDIPIPDWALAPLVVAASTFPIQLAHGHKINKDQATAAASPMGATAEGAAPDAAMA